MCIFLTIFTQLETSTMQVHREFDPSGTDGKERSCGSLVNAQASARVGAPTAPPFFCSADQGGQHVRKSLCECLDMCSTVNRLILRVSAMTR